MMKVFGLVELGLRFGTTPVAERSIKPAGMLDGMSI
jgi:hypothetical protein